MQLRRKLLRSMLRNKKKDPFGDAMAMVVDKEEQKLEDADMKDDIGIDKGDIDGDDLKTSLTNGSLEKHAPATNGKCHDDTCKDIEMNGES